MNKTTKFALFSFSILLLFVLIIFIFNPLNLRNKIVAGAINLYFQTENLEKTGEIVNPEVKTGSTETKSTSTNSSSSQNVNPLLTEEMVNKLEDMGVNTEALPNEITPAMQECFVEKLGQERVDEIIGGASPGPIEFIKTKDCLNK